MLIKCPITETESIIAFHYIVNALFSMKSLLITLMFDAVARVNAGQCSAVMQSVTMKIMLVGLKGRSVLDATQHNYIILQLAYLK